MPDKDTIKQIVDGIFSVLEQEFADRPMVRLMLEVLDKFADQAIDKFLAAQRS